MSKCFWGNFKNTMILLVVIILGSGCAPKSDTDSKNEYPFPMYNTSSPLYKELNSATITCEDTQCESNKSDFESIGVVGMLVEGKPSDKEFGLGRCTGFLYGSQEIVALNSHCITDSMWENRDNCEEYLGIKFPAVPGYDEEIRMCDKILFRSDLTDANAFDSKADYAFFKIKKINRQALRMAKTPVRNQDTISFRKVNPLIGSLSGRLDYSYCLAQTESILNSNYKNEWSDTGLGISYGAKDYSKKCEIRKGNSGSPVLNANNEVVGFAQSYATANFLMLLKSDLFKDEVKKKYQIDFALELPEKLPGHFQFTQSLCARDPNNIDADNKLCAQNRKLIPEKNEEALVDFKNAKNIDEYMKSVAEEVKNNYPRFFQLDVQKKKDFYSYDINPRCVLSEAHWDKANLDIKSSFLSGNGKNISIINKPLSVDLKMTMYIDENLIYKYKVLSHSFNYGDLNADVSTKSIKVSKAFLVGKYFSYKKEEAVPGIDWCR